MIRAKWTGGMDKVVESLFCKHEALSSNYHHQKKQKTKNKPQYTMQRFNPNVNYGFWVTMRRHCRFTYYKKHTTLVCDVESKEAVCMYTFCSILV
jgi:hypothetical protein